MKRRSFLKSVPAVAVASQVLPAQDATPPFGAEFPNLDSQTTGTWWAPRAVAAPKANPDAKGKAKGKGKGNAGPFNGVAGDLIVVIEEIEHDELRREGEHLHYDAVVNFADVVMGESIEIPTVNGKAKIKIEPGTQSGKVLRLRGKGLPSVQGYGTGDLFVHINVYTPNTITKEEREWMEKIKNSENFIPGAEAKSKGFFGRMRDMFS